MVLLVPSRSFTKSVPVVEARESRRVAGHESVEVGEAEAASPSLRPEEGEAELHGGDAAPSRHEVAPGEVLQVLGAGRVICNDLNVTVISAHNSFSTEMLFDGSIIRNSIPNGKPSWTTLFCISFIMSQY